ncbi:MAG: O-antigen ligase family protein [Stappiaceae bacterium]
MRDIGTNAIRPPMLLSGQRIGDYTIGFCIFISGFVIREPAPYDLVMVAVIAIWALCGLRIRSEIGPLTVLFLLYMAGGCLAVTQVTAWDKAPLYMAVSGFLVLTSIFFASIVSDQPSRLALIEKSYIAAAVVVSLIAVLAYFRLIPGAENFIRYSRAMGTFQDPNVYGPFCVLPTIFLFRRILTGSVSKILPLLPLFGIIMLGIFLAFSRAAWGLTAFSFLFVSLLTFVNETNSLKRLRLIGLAVAGLVMLIFLIAFALSLDSVSSLFAERAKLVQDYDGGHLGRFARFALGFELVMQTPLGIGPLEFWKLFTEDPHNIYLKGFIAYGWIGGISYLILVIWTLAALFPLLFKPRPWQSYAVCVFAVLLGHCMIGMIIDTDHWRHVYLLYGLAWGMIAAEKLWQKKHLSRGMPTHQRNRQNTAQPLAKYL